MTSPGSVKSGNDAEPAAEVWYHPGSGERIGCQRPRIESWPALTEWSAAEEAIEILRLAGREPDPWQRHVLEHALGEREDGRWSAFEVALVVPRQCGKNVVLEARELAGLFLWGEKVIIHSAHQMKTARKSFRDMQRLIRTTPELLEQVAGYKPDVHGTPEGRFAQLRGIRDSTNETVIELANGNRLEYHARSGGGGRGFTGDLIILDEAYDLDPEEVAAMLPTMAARSMEGNPQIWYTSSAGLPKSVHLASIRERGKAGSSPKLAYFEWSAPESVSSDDVDAVYQANPGLGLRISLEYVLEEEMEGLGDDEFRRERLGIWEQLGGTSAISESEWQRVLDAGSVPGGFAAFALDVPRSRDSANVAAVSQRPDGRLHVEIIERRNGTSWVPLYLRELQQAWGRNGTPVVLDAAGGAGALINDLDRERVRYTLVNGRQIARACGQVFDDVLERRLVHRGQEELDAAVAKAGTKTTGESAWRWVATERIADVSPLYAVTLARHGWSVVGERLAKANERRQGGLSGGRSAGGRRPGGRALTGRR